MTNRETPAERERWHHISQVLISRLAILMTEYPDSEYLQHVHQQVLTDIMQHDTAVVPPYKPHYEVS